MAKNKLILVNPKYTKKKAKTIKEYDPCDNWKGYDRFGGDEDDDDSKEWNKMLKTCHKCVGKGKDSLGNICECKKGGK